MDGVRNEAEVVWMCDGGHAKRVTEGARSGHMG